MEVTLRADGLIPAGSTIDAALVSKFQAALNTAQNGETADVRLPLAHIALKHDQDLNPLHLTPSEMLVYIAATFGFFEAVARASDTMISFDKRLKNISGAKAAEQQDA